MLVEELLSKTIGDDVSIIDDVERANNFASTIVYSQVPLILVKGMMGDYANDQVNLKSDGISDEDSSVKGLLLSKKNIKDIISYVDFALTLPTIESGVEAYVGFTKTTEPNKALTIDEFQKFFVMANNHASGWSPLEAEIKTVGTTLSIYSIEFMKTADAILDAIKDMPIFKKIGDIGDTNITLDKDDQEYVVAFRELMKELKEAVSLHHNKTNNLAIKLGKYREEVDTKIQPKSASLLSEVSKLKTDEKGIALKKEIDDLKDEIKALDKAYDEYVGLAFTGAAGLILGPLGIISWAITGGVYGDKAEKTRKKRNERQKELNNKIEEYNRISELIKSMSMLDVKLSDMKASINSAQTGIKNLENAWVAVDQYIETVDKNLADMKDSKMLLSFKKDMETDKACFSEVGDITTDLIKLFESAISEARGGK